MGCTRRRQRPRPIREPLLPSSRFASYLRWRSIRCRSKSAALAVLPTRMQPGRLPTARSARMNASSCRPVDRLGQLRKNLPPDTLTRGGIWKRACSKCTSIHWAQGYMSGLNIASIKNGEGARDLSAISKTNQMSTIRMYCDSHPLLNYFLGVGEAYRSLPKTPSPKG